MQEPLITASIGLIKTDHNNYFLQVITAENTNYYCTQISKEEAEFISERDNLEIETMQVPGGTILLRRLHNKTFYPVNDENYL